MRTGLSLLLLATLLVMLLPFLPAFANGGPFVMKYPAGDPSARGIPARLDPSLMPAREERLRVVKEDLTFVYALARPVLGGGRSSDAPLVKVTAAYTIENPTDKEIEVDFGFPILRGIARHSGLEPRSWPRVQLEKTQVDVKVIPLEAIYGVIRNQARETIDKGIAANARLARHVETLRTATGDKRSKARLELAAYLTKKRKWNKADADLMVEYACCDFSKPVGNKVMNLMSVIDSRTVDPEMQKLLSTNLGPLNAIGDQKATQFFARLASRFDKRVIATYEGLFTAWGGDVRERSVDIITGQLRPRENTIKKTIDTDTTIYARIEYLDKDTELTAEQKASCTNVLKNLPVVFTFAPMNLLHYQVKFPAKTTKVLTVEYYQYCHTDTAEPASYQFDYVVHPASYWKSFGPINLTIYVPKDLPFRLSESCEVLQNKPNPFVTDMPCDIYFAELTKKTGTLCLAVGGKVWDALVMEKGVKVHDTVVIPNDVRTLPAEF